MDAFARPLASPARAALSTVHFDYSRNIFFRFFRHSSVGIRLISMSMSIDFIFN